MAGHTPGRWTARAENPSFQVSAWSVHVTEGDEDRCLATFWTWPETEANARLCAAAPRMCDLLRRLARRIETSHLTAGPGRASLMTQLDREYDEIMETIEAAEGREG